MKGNILSEIRKRKSPLVFKSREIEKSKIDLIIEAARWAPSCFNNQPWNFVFVHKKDSTRKAVEKSLYPGNGWAKKAPYLVVVGSDPEDDCSTNNLPYYAYDSGMSVMSMAIEAEHQGLRMHQMAGYDEGRARKAADFPDNYRIIVMFALGYEDNPEKLWDKLTEKIKNRLSRPRTRKPAEELFRFRRF